jgi:hypothetical protein
MISHQSWGLKRISVAPLAVADGKRLFWIVMPLGPCDKVKSAELALTNFLKELRPAL